MSVQVASIAQAYEARTPRSRELYQRARNTFPSGVTHDSRYMEPYPISVTRAEGSRKWDVDGNEYVDYFGGHGALILGHNHPAIVEAVADQLSKGTHYGASQELELEWGEQIRDMIPSAEKVRFTGSGTEASVLALRVVRAFTGKPKILRFVSHFHGWHDQVAFGSGDSLPAGIPPGLAENMILCEPNNLDQVRETLESREDVAAVILEPTGSSFGRVPTSGAFLKQLRELTREQDVLLIFDEVITGFRCSPGGAQGFYGVTPDLTLMAKIMAGGFPGGALAGRADVMDVMTFQDDATWNREGRVAHQGTYNANPISARAGLTALKIVADTGVTEAANRFGEALRNAMNEVIRSQQVNWVIYGEFSGFHVLVNPGDEAISLEDIYSGKVPHTVLKGGMPPALMYQVRQGFLTEGVDLISWPGAVISGVHSDEDLNYTVEAFGRLLRHVKEAGNLE